MPPSDGTVDGHALLADLTAALGTRHTRTDEDIMAPFLVDERRRDAQFSVRSLLIPSPT